MQNYGPSWIIILKYLQSFHSTIILYSFCNFQVSLWPVIKDKIAECIYACLLLSSLSELRWASTGLKASPHWLCLSVQGRLPGGMSRGHWGRLGGSCSWCSWRPGLRHCQESLHQDTRPEIPWADSQHWGRMLFLRWLGKALNWQPFKNSSFDWTFS